MTSNSKTIQCDRGQPTRSSRLQFVALFRRIMSSKQLNCWMFFSQDWPTKQKLLLVTDILSKTKRKGQGMIQQVISKAWKTKGWFILMISKAWAWLPQGYSFCATKKEPEDLSLFLQMIANAYSFAIFNRHRNKQSNDSNQCCCTIIQCIQQEQRFCWEIAASLCQAPNG